MKRSVLFGILAAMSLAQTSSTPDLPKPYATPSAENRPQVIAQPSGMILLAPEGFQSTVWAQGFATPRYLLQGNSDEILLADSGASAESAAVGKQAGPTHDGTVYIFPNGNPTRRKALISGLNRPYGMALWKNYLYVAESDSVKRYAYDATKAVVGKGEEVISLKGFNNGHWTRSLLFDKSGSKLYLGVGSEGNVDTGEDPRRAAINRYNPDGSGHEIFASGTRNPVGLHWDANGETLWAAVQERDELGDDLVPDYFTRVQQGDFFGWPYAYSGQNKDPRIEDKGGMVAKSKAPDVMLGAHVAVLDYTFYTGDQFPAMYHGGVFLAFHGSWNRSKRVGYEVAFLPFQDGKPIGPPRDFLTGWMLAPEKKEVWGRPVGVFQMKDGSLLVTDDGGKKIWRVSYSSKYKG